MKIGLILLSFLLSGVGSAQNCTNCRMNQNLLPQVPEPPLELIKIEKATYEVNTKASFCKRPVEMIDTIVIHHSETPNTDTAQKINEYHLSRGTPEDPWYMVAYSFIINSPYSGSNTPTPVVTEGRPLEIVGAHAGAGIYAPMNQAQKKMFDEGKVTCGKENEEFVVNPKMVKDDSIYANVTTIGIVVVGNYAPFSKENPNGYSILFPRNPTKGTQDLIARTSCQLQKKYPNMKSIKWHDYYRPTTCPGSIKKYISKIISLARNYGCEFN